MDIERFIQQDIIDFLTKEQEKDIQIKGVKDEENILFDPTRDYLKEVRQQLLMNNLAAAKDVFDTVVIAYNKAAATDPQRKSMFDVLQEMFAEIKGSVQTNQLVGSLQEEVKELDTKGVFASQVLPREIPRPMVKGTDFPGTRDVMADESFNLLREDIMKKGGVDAASSKDLAVEIAREITKDIPMEESAQLSKLFGGGTIIENKFFIEPSALPAEEMDFRFGAGQVTPQKAAQEKVPEELRKMMQPPVPEVRQARPAPQGATQAQVPPVQIVRQSQPAVIQAPQPFVMQAQARPQYSEEAITNIVTKVAKEMLAKDQPAQAKGQPGEIRIQEPAKIIFEGSALQDSLKMKDKNLAETKDFLKKKKEDIRKERDLIWQREVEEKKLEQEKNWLLSQEAELKTKLEEQGKVEKEKELLKKRQEELNQKFKEIQAIKIDDEKLKIQEQCKELDRKLELFNTMAGLKKSIHAAILQNDAAGAKKGYLKVKTLFSQYPQGDEKKGLYKELVNIYNLITFLEKTQKQGEEAMQKVQALKPEQAQKATISVEKIPVRQSPKSEEKAWKERQSRARQEEEARLSKMREVLFSLNTSVRAKNAEEFKKRLAEAKAQITSYPDQQKQEIFQKIVDTLERRMDELQKPRETPTLQEGTLAAPHTEDVQPRPADMGDQKREVSNLYFKAVSLLYTDRKQEAVELFKKIISIEPGNIAAQIRLREATSPSSK